MYLVLSAMPEGWRGEATVVPRRCSLDAGQRLESAPLGFRVTSAHSRCALAIWGICAEALDILQNEVVASEPSSQ